MSTFVYNFHIISSNHDTGIVPMEGLHFAENHSKISLQGGAISLEAAQTISIGNPHGSKDAKKKAKRERKKQKVQEAKEELAREIARGRRTLEHPADELMEVDNSDDGGDGEFDKEFIGGKSISGSISQGLDRIGIQGAIQRPRIGQLMEVTTQSNDEVLPEWECRCGWTTTDRIKAFGRRRVTKYPHKCLQCKFHRFAGATPATLRGDFIDNLPFSHQLTADLQALLRGNVHLLLGRQE